MVSSILFKLYVQGLRANEKQQFTFVNDDFE